MEVAVEQVQNERVAQTPTYLFPNGVAGSENRKRKRIFLHYKFRRKDIDKLNLKLPYSVEMVVTGKEQRH